VDHSLARRQQSRLVGFVSRVKVLAHIAETAKSAAQIMAFEDFAVAPLYERRLLPQEETAVIDRRYSRKTRSGVKGDRHQQGSQARRTASPGGARCLGLPA